MKSTTVFWLLVCIVIVGVGIRAYEITARSLWFDEAFSWRLAEFPFTEMIARDIQDVHPPLYYVLLKGWGTVFGTSLLSLRLFSVFFAGATIVMGYVFTLSAWRSRSLALVAATFIAVSAWQIPFAWEARMYTQGGFFALLSSWMLLMAVREQPQKLSWWLGYSASAAALAYTHYFAFFTLAAQAVFVIGYMIWQTKGRLGELFQMRFTWYAIASGMVALLLYAPWVPIFIQQNSQVQESFWIPAIGGWSIPDTFYRMMAPTSGIPPHTGFGIVLSLLPMLITIIMWVLLVLTCRTYEKTDKARLSMRNISLPVRAGGVCDGAWLTMLLGLVPFLCVIAISFMGQSLYQDRYLVFANLFILIGFAAVFMRIPHTLTRRVLVTLFIAGSLFAYGRYWMELDIQNKPGAHAAAQHVFSQYQPGEAVLVSSPFIFFAIDHYAQEEFGKPNVVKLYSETGEVAHFAGGPILRPQDSFNPNNIHSQNVVWMIDTTGFGGTETQLPPEWQRVSREAYPEVFGYQGEVIVSKYTR